MIYVVKAMEIIEGTTIKKWKPLIYSHSWSLFFMIFVIKGYGSYWRYSKSLIYGHSWSLFFQLICDWKNSRVTPRWVNYVPCLTDFSVLTIPAAVLTQTESKSSPVNRTSPPAPSQNSGSRESCGWTWRLAFGVEHVRVVFGKSMVDRVSLNAWSFNAPKAPQKPTVYSPVLRVHQLLLHQFLKDISCDSRCRLHRCLRFLSYPVVLSFSLAVLSPRSLLFIVSHFRWSTSCSDWPGDWGQNQLEINFMLWLPVMTHVLWPWIRHFCVVVAPSSLLIWCPGPGTVALAPFAAHFLTKLARQWHELKRAPTSSESDFLVLGWLMANCRHGTVLVLPSIYQSHGSFVDACQVGCVRQDIRYRMYSVRCEHELGHWTSDIGHWTLNIERGRLVNWNVYMTFYGLPKRPITVTGFQWSANS